MKKLAFTLLVLVVGTLKSVAQGCSDAGFCTIHSIKNNTEKAAEDKSNNDLIVGFSFGKGERSTSIYSPYIEYTRSLSYRSSVTGKIIFSSVTGELASTSGLGDLFLSFNHAFDVKSKWQKSFVIGLKIPFDKADIVSKGIHLPMPYQTSLGTTDLVLGLNFIREAFGATIAVQQPLTSTNGNRFLPADYPSEPLAAKYLPTNEFSRKGDVLLRFSYNVRLNDRLTFRPSFLGIYHEANDSYLDENKNRITIPDSKGLTLNANIFFDYKLNRNSGLELSLGTPFVVRDNRPDGLTRSFIASLEYKFSF